MTIDRSRIRVKAMLIAPNADGSGHLVSVNGPTAENPRGYHRLVGGSVELGETHRAAIIREVDEELGVRILDLAHLGVVENIFHLDGELGHEIVALYTGRLDPEPPAEGGTLTESDGSVVPVAWRPFADADLTVPLYPSGASEWIRDLRRRGPYVRRSSDGDAGAGQAARTAAVFSVIRESSRPSRIAPRRVPSRATRAMRTSSSSTSHGKPSPR